jgi:site-specific DNA-cytosine methylase
MAARSNRQGMDGKHSAFFFMWCSIVRHLKFKVVIAENVRQFGSKPYDDELGDLYVCSRVVHNPVTQGWATERQRQFVYLFLKEWIYPVMGSANIPASPVSLEATLQLDRVRSLFDRKCMFTWDRYLIASDMEIAAELEWAASRKDVRQRHAHGDDVFGDVPGSFLHALNLSERTRLTQYRASNPHDVADLSQNPITRPLVSRRNNLNTIMKNVGIMFLPEFATYTPEGQTTAEPRALPSRWLTASELFTAMGFPVTESAVSRTFALCHVSRGLPAVPGRSHRSLWNQVGNTMHLNSIGAAKLSLYLVLPCLGCKTDATRSASAASSSGNSFGSRFHLARKRARFTD